MYSLLLPPACIGDLSRADLDRQTDAQLKARQQPSRAHSTGAGHATGLLRVGAMSRRLPMAQRAARSKWSLV
jgi:hypothetical protein